MSNQVLQKREKLNHLLKEWLPGTVMPQSWLEGHGISRQLSSFYVKNGWIEKLGQGAFLKAGDRVDWKGGLYTLQKQLNLKVHLGGRSLLEVIGASHFVPVGSRGPLYIYADGQVEKKQLPKWFVTGFKELVSVIYLPRGLFLEPFGIEELNESHFSIRVSSKERALMEVLVLVPQTISYSHAYLLFQGQETLRPKVVQKLLECCNSFKVKRLFLHLGKKCGLPWMNYLNVTHIDLGQGKRQIGSGGWYDNEYKISVPKLNSSDELDNDVEV